MSGNPDDLLLGEFAVNFGYATRDQIAEFAARQDAGDDRPLGRILIDEGCCTPEQMEELLGLQGRKLAEIHPGTNRPKKESLFGQIVQMKQYARSGEVHKALRLQKKLAEEGTQVRLGELLVAKSEMTAAQVARALGEQGKMLFVCDACCESHTLDDYDGTSETHPCPDCGGDMTIPTELGMSDD